MIKITIEAIGPDARDEAEHFCLCLGHQDQLIDSFLKVLMDVANGAPLAGVLSGLGEGEEEPLPPRTPGRCRMCADPMPMPGNLGMCEVCRDHMIGQQIIDREMGVEIPPPPPLHDPTLGLMAGMFNPPTVGTCLQCGGDLGTGFMFCVACAEGGRRVNAG